MSFLGRRHTVYIPEPHWKQDVHLSAIVKGATWPSQCRSTKSADGTSTSPTIVTVAGALVSGRVSTFSINSLDGWETRFVGR